MDTSALETNWMPTHWASSASNPSSPKFLCQMPFLLQPSHNRRNLVKLSCHNVAQKKWQNIWNKKNQKTRMWANTQPDGRPAKHRWRPLFNAAKFGWRHLGTIAQLCSNAAKMRNLLKFAGVPQTTAWISAVNRPKFTILWGHVEDISLLNKFFSDCRYVP